MKTTTIIRRWLKLAEGGYFPEDDILNPKWGCKTDFENDEVPGTNENSAIEDLKTFSADLENLTVADVVLGFEGFKDYMQRLAGNFESAIKEHAEEVQRYEDMPDPISDYHHRVMVMGLDTPEAWFENFKREVEDD